MNNTIKHLDNGDFEVNHVNKENNTELSYVAKKDGLLHQIIKMRSDEIKRFVYLTQEDLDNTTQDPNTLYMVIEGYDPRPSLLKRIINWIKQPTLKETKW